MNATKTKDSTHHKSWPAKRESKMSVSDLGSKCGGQNRSKAENYPFLVNQIKTKLRRPG